MLYYCSAIIWGKILLRTEIIAKKAAFLPKIQLDKDIVIENS